MFLHSGLERGSADLSVQLPAINLKNDEIAGPVSAGIQFNSDGNIYRYYSSGYWQQWDTWLLEGSAAGYYIVRTKLGPDSLNTFDSGTLQQMNSTNSYALTQTAAGVRQSQVTFSISNDSGGSNLLVTRTYLIYAENFDLL